MPKQRNHPHHHRLRRQRTSLQLPQTEFAPIEGIRHITYPTGWKLRSPRYGRMPMIAVAVMLVILLLVLVGLVLGFDEHRRPPGASSQQCLACSCCTRVTRPDLLHSPKETPPWQPHVHEPERRYECSALPSSRGELTV